MRQLASLLFGSLSPQRLAVEDLLSNSAANRKHELQSEGQGTPFGRVAAWEVAYSTLRALRCVVIKVQARSTKLKRDTNDTW